LGLTQPKAQQMPLEFRFFVVVKVGARMNHHRVVEPLQITTVKLRRITKLWIGSQNVQQIQQRDLISVNRGTSEKSRCAAVAL
jgi:hypothetical protein